MKRTGFLLCLLLATVGLAACGDDQGGEPDASLDASIDASIFDDLDGGLDGAVQPAPGDCEGIRDAWLAIVEDLDDDSCTTAAECTEMGGTAELTCNCTPHLGYGDGATPALGYERSGAAAMAARFFAECPNSHNVCDRAPPDIGCNDGHCTLTEHSCLKQP